MTRWRGVWLSALVLVTTFPLPSAAQGVGGRIGDRASRSTMEGFVRDAETGDPLEGVLITIGWMGGGSRVSTSCLTDENGQYRIRVGPEARVDLTLERLGYATLYADGVRVEPAIRVDFALTPEPLALVPFMVIGRARTVTEGGLEQTPPSRRVTRRVGSLVLEEDVAMPLARALLVGAASTTGGNGGGGPSLPGAGGTDALGVGGSLTRQGATYVDGAPAQLAEPVSFLASPSRRSRSDVQVWDAGAPARITGGLEYVLDVQRRPPATPQGMEAEADLDLVRASGRVSERWRRVATEMSGQTTLPWTTASVGEGGHRSRMAGAHVWAAPAHRQSLAGSFSIRDELLPAGSSSRAGSAGTRDVTGSLRWDVGVGPGVLVARVGSGRSGVGLPPVGGVGVATGVSVHQGRSLASLEYRGALGRSLVTSVGGDRLSYRWRGTLSAHAAKWGLFGEMTWAPPGSDLAVRAGSRLDLVGHGQGTVVAPRARIEWRVHPDLLVTLGSGVHHQILMAGAPDRPVSRPAEPILARGVHGRVTAILEVADAGLRLDAYLKRLDGLPSSVGSVAVFGGSIGLEVPFGSTGNLGAAATLERRHGVERTDWIRMAVADLEQELPFGTALRLHGEASRGPGGLVLAELVDTLGVLAGGSATLSDPEMRPWSLRVDGEVSRAFRGGPGEPEVSVYVRILNVLGQELRPLFARSAYPVDPRVPRVLVVGAGVAIGPRHAGRDR